jgi:hypothetical protein
MTKKANEVRLAAMYDVTTLREAFESSGLTSYEVALRMGWFDGNVPDSNRVNRALGLAPYSPSHGYPMRLRTRTTPALACALLDAMGLIPAEVGW